MSMELNPRLVFRPLPEAAHSHFVSEAPDLGPLANLLGTWQGKGFNTIWRPNNTPGQDRFLELNITDESVTYEVIGGFIPNRGFLQGDINMVGLHYLQQIADANIPNTALHIEPGIWAVVPPTSDPAVPATVIRMASIPHGTAILAQGTATTQAGAPTIPNIDILPFPIGVPSQKNSASFPELNLQTPSAFRTPADQMDGVTQDLINNPNSFLTGALQQQEIISTTVLDISTTDNPVPGGGTANTAFLQGTLNRPNAVAAQVTATFWIQTVKGLPDFLQLQYSQSVLLNFNGLSWPHVTVATLKKQISS